ncbi:hypothetical protein [Desertivirga arenae]|nr:hypothetical protein [Pedobacter sp. SYSU D00823]
MKRNLPILIRGVLLIAAIWWLFKLMIGEYWEAFASKYFGK